MGALVLDLAEDETTGTLRSKNVETLGLIGNDTLFLI